MPVKNSATLTGITANGSPGSPTTELTLTFDKAVSGLSAGDITLSMPNPFGVSRGTLSGSGSSYTLGVRAPVDGNLTVTIENPLLSISGSPKTVGIYGDGSISVKPLVENQWADGNLPEASSVDWYSFAATAGTTYRIWWNERSLDGNGTKTGDVVVGAWRADGTLIFGGTNIDEDSGWADPQTIPASATDSTVYVRIHPWGADPYTRGTYGVVYSTGTTRPN
jgi:hypothetical protein